MHRRNFLRAAGAGAAFFRPDAVERARAAVANGQRSAEDCARDESFWREMQLAFTQDRNWINLNNGGVTPAPRIVQEAMGRYLAFSNQATTHHMWRVLEPQIEDVRRRLAADFGCDPEEMAITRNASESLVTVQYGLDLKPGDEVVTTDQDYPRMLTAWRQRARRDGITLRELSFPVPPPSMDSLYEMFEKAIGPRTKVIHFCHITNLTGQIFPVKRLCQMARARGIEAVVDGAHAYSQFPFKLADLDCDYYGTSLHKWLCAPHGTGFLYVRKAKIPKIWPMVGAPPEMDGNIRKFEEIGTHPAANHNAISDALSFNETIGTDRKAARLRHLRHLWTERLERIPGFANFTSGDPAQSCGIGTFGLAKRDMAKLYGYLLEQHIVTSPIIRNDFQGIRVTPNVYTQLSEIDRFCDAVEAFSRAA